ncbi:MAG: histidine phosphatase family protein [Dehalococcoidia bacterium]|nr:histidine phosphatase family protein [Dehalococcoidia bacterium]
METTVYFVRHAQAFSKNLDDSERTLTEKGLIDRKLVTSFLDGRKIDILLSSPCKRAIDTIKEFAEKYNFHIRIIPWFREGSIGSEQIESYNEFSKRQWTNFQHKLVDGESLQEIQNRNILALKMALREYAGLAIVIGSHGTALSTIIRFFVSSFGYAEFSAIKELRPWVVKFKFEDEVCTCICAIDLFSSRNDMFQITSANRLATVVV